MRRIVLAVTVFFLAACSPTATIDALPDAKKLAERFFELYKTQQYEALDALYGDEFWEATPEDIWYRILPNVQDELGAIKQCELQNWHQTTTASTSRSGNIVQLSYACQHEKYDSIFSFTILKPLSGGESKILGQNFSSLGLLLE
ncbi:MAG: DUF3887 domain-containing protein [Porticoccaceae bacterium]|nr:DUF3887 domain-containing protein [Porticoccaceae bacterium]